MTKIAVVGPGAIGCTLFAMVAQNPAHHVVACVRTPFETLEVRTPEKLLSFKPTVLTRPTEASPVDWVFVATKTYDIAAAAHWLRVLVGPKTRVAIFQNGVEHRANFAPYVTDDALVPVVIDCPAERTGPGKVHQRGPVKVTIPDDENGRALAELLRPHGAEISLTDDWITAAWRKLCLNAPGAVCAATMQPTGVIQRTGMPELVHAIVREVIAVGRREGATLADSVADAVVASFHHAPPDSINSLYGDRLAGRRMEIDARNGVVVRRGRHHGITTPHNETIFTLLNAVQPSSS
ncbi:2-dehydropantoate 2-reductase [Oleiharenicola lentus]|uniref:2-dehydropantoate 2-reductase n=1 Tax=Oleiharenicola lentus TaxID=2508720 RepID=UPI003F6819DD